MQLRTKTLPATLLIISAAILFSCNRSSVIANNREPATPPAKEKYVKDEVIVKFKEYVTENRIEEISTSLGCEIIKSIGPTKTFLIKINTGEDVKEIVNKYNQFDEVEYAQPNYIYHITPKNEK